MTIYLITGFIQYTFLLIYPIIFLVEYYKYKEQDIDNIAYIFKTRIKHKGIGTDVVIECGLDLFFFIVIVTTVVYILGVLCILNYKKFFCLDNFIKKEMITLFFVVLFYVLCFIFIHYFLEERYLIITMYHMALEENAEYYFELASENTIAKKGKSF